jgi:3-oxoacyl-[acyl-carrier protein] reductase
MRYNGPMQQRLRNQVALVTGGSRGIGRAVCLALAAEGASLIVHYHTNLPAAEQVRKLLEPSPASLVQADLSSTDSISRMVESLGDDKLDILVNNAGIWKPTPLGSTTAARLYEVLHTNLAGMFWLTQAVLPKLCDGARIVNMSSTAGRVGIAGGRSVYGAAKAGIDSLTKCWALELAPRRIRVNAVAPGYVETDMTAEHLSDPATRENAQRRHPLGRLCTADEVARAVAFLCTEDSVTITGQSLNVSGGFVI